MDLDRLEIAIEHARENYEVLWTTMVKPPITTPGMAADGMERIRRIVNQYTDFPQDNYIVSKTDLQCLTLLAQFGLEHAIIRAAEEKITAERVLRI